MTFKFLKRCKNQFKIIRDVFFGLVGFAQDKMCRCPYMERMMKAVTKVCSSERAATLWILHFENCCLAVMGLINLPKCQLGSATMRNIFFWKKLISNCNQLLPNLCQKSKVVPFLTISSRLTIV